MELVELLGVAEWMKYNAMLQKKKSELRKELASLGVVKKDKLNDYDGYQYLSEAGYKELFTKLFSNHGLELTTNEIEYSAMDIVSQSQPNGRKVQLEFVLTDTETGFYEKSLISGEGIDRGDKAGYKAYTGAIKYYLANTFMVATGDDAEMETPDAKARPKQKSNSSQPKEERKASDKQVYLLQKYYQGENLTKLLNKYNIQSLNELPLSKASELIEANKKREAQA